MEIFYEQNVSNTRIDKHRKRNTVLSILQKVFLVLAFIIALIVFFTLQLRGALAVILQIVFGLLLLAPFVLAYFFIRRYLRNANSEYDYILNGGILRIVQVILRNKRKLFAAIPIDCIESIGKITCEAYERYAAGKGTKKKYAICNYDDEENIAYIRYRSEGEDFLLHFEPDEEMVSALRRSLPRFSIMDKSMNAGAIVPKK